MNKQNRKTVNSAKGALLAAAEGFDETPEAMLTGREVAEILRSSASDMEAYLAQAGDMNTSDGLGG